MRYFFAQDGECHWYIVPADKRNEWNEWKNLDEDDPRSWDAPEWAKELGQHPSCMTFENPE